MTTVEIGLLFYFVLSLGWSYALMFGAWRLLKKPSTLFIPEQPMPLVSVLVPAYNEEIVIVESVVNTLRNQYRNIEVCVCDDASTDSTKEKLISAFGLKPAFDLDADMDGEYWTNGNVKLFSARKNGGRAAALNKALHFAEGKYCVQTDADTLIDPHALVKLVQTIMTPGKKYGAVGGTLLLVNEVKEHPMGIDWYAQISKKWIAGTQAVEYLRAFLYGRLGLNNLGGNVIVSGAFGMFKTDLVRYLGGWNEKSVAEDFDLTLRVREAGGAVRFIPDPVAYTQAPADLRNLGRQRARWHRGLTEIFFRGPGRDCMFKHGILGKFVLPVHFFVEWLAPIMEAIGLTLVIYHLIHGQHLIFLAPIMVAGYLLNVLLSLISIKFEKDNFNRYRGSYSRGILYSLVEPFWYRPLMVIWRLKGMFEYMFGKQGWGGTITRTKFMTVAMLLLLVSPVHAASFVQVSSSSEVGEVSTRVDNSLFIVKDNIDADVTVRTRDDELEFQYSLGYRIGLNDRVGTRIHTSVSDRGLIFPRWTAGITTDMVLGNFVPSIDYTHQFFDNLNLGFISPQLDYYIGNWRFAVRGMIATDQDVYAMTFYVQHIADELQWTLFASRGNEILDIPVIIGMNEVVGGMLKVSVTKSVGVLIGTSYGSRNDRTYATITGGLRFDF